MEAEAVCVSLLLFFGSLFVMGRVYRNFKYRRCLFWLQALTGLVQYCLSKMTECEMIRKHGCAFVVMLIKVILWPSGQCFNYAGCMFWCVHFPNRVISGLELWVLYPDLCRTLQNPLGSYCELWAGSLSGQFDEKKTTLKGKQQWDCGHPKWRVVASIQQTWTCKIPSGRCFPMSIVVGCRVTVGIRPCWCTSPKQGLMSGRTNKRYTI